MGKRAWLSNHHEVAIKKHNVSNEHKDGRSMWFSEKNQKMLEDVAIMQDICKDRVLTCMKLTYFFSKQDLSLMKYEALCNLAYAQKLLA